MPIPSGIYKTFILSIFFLFGSHYLLNAQLKEIQYRPISQKATVLTYLQDLENKTGISLSYNNSQFDTEKIVSLQTKSYTVSNALETIFDGYFIVITERPNQKILFTLIPISENEPIEKKFSVQGVITDKESGEKLYGAAIYQLGYDRGTFSNEEGYYHLENIQSGDLLSISYVGYKDTVFILREPKSYNVQLRPSLEVNTIVITEIIDKRNNPDTGGDFLDINGSTAKVSILGDRDILNIARQSTGVYSGSEGQGGLLVRGGTPSQNLMMLDNVPMYAVNHMADISSIFIKEATRDAQLIKSGFPSRYSGRLSSVMSVNLKDGNKNNFSGSATAGLPGVKLFLEGPITPKTSFMVGARVSWIDKYLNPLVDKFTAFNAINLTYHDFVGKVSHSLSNTSNISLSTYIGGDDVSLTKDLIERNNDTELRTFESTKFGWDNKLVSLNFNKVIGNKWIFSAHAGAINYGYRSRASYDFTTLRENVQIKQEETDVITDSNIKDYMSSVNFDYYLNNQHRIKFGGSYTHHKFSPKIQQNESIALDPKVVINPDSLTIGSEVSMYLEDNFKPSDQISIYAGINYSVFSVRGNRYNYFQPRLNFVLQANENVNVTVSGSRMVQFVHLLVNNGLGLPSDLWVPSTDRIAPEISDQLSLTVTSKIGRSHIFSMGGYLKKQNNIILYSDPYDLYNNVLNGSSSSNIKFVNDRDWERRIDIGSRDLRGLEVSFSKTQGRWQYIINYTKSATENRFRDINNGNAFRDQFDRPHDINTSTSYKINDKWTVGAQWVYGSGNTFTLALQEFDSVLGVKLLNNEERNNYRMPAYHHLDLQATYNRQTANKGWKLDFGIYNVYNRYNPYYLYLYNNPVRNKRVLKKLSLFPILPYANLTWAF